MPSRIGSRDLLFRALSGQSTPRVPTGPLAVHFCAGLAGLIIRHYTTQAQPTAAR